MDSKNHRGSKPLPAIDKNNNTTRRIVVIDWTQVLYDAKKKIFYCGALELLKDLQAQQYEVFIVSEDTPESSISNALKKQNLCPAFINMKHIFSRAMHLSLPSKLRSPLILNAVIRGGSAPSEAERKMAGEMLKLAANLESDAAQGVYNPFYIVEALRHFRKFQQDQCLILGNNNYDAFRVNGYRALEVKYSRWNKRKPADSFFQDVRIALDPIAAVDIEIKRQAKLFEKRSKHWWHGPNNKKKSNLLSTCGLYAIRNISNKPISVRDLVYTACINSGSIATASNFHRIVDWSFFGKTHFAKSRQKIDHIVQVAEKIKAPSSSL